MSDFVSSLFSLALTVFSRLDNMIVLYCSGLVFWLFCFSLVRRLIKW